MKRKTFRVLKKILRKNSSSYRIPLENTRNTRLYTRGYGGENRRKKLSESIYNPKINKMSNKMPKHQTTIYLEFDTYESLKKYAEVMGKDRSEVIDTCLKIFFQFDPEFLKTMLEDAIRGAFKNLFTDEKK